MSYLLDSDLKELRRFTETHSCEVIAQAANLILGIEPGMSMSDPERIAYIAIRKICEASYEEYREELVNRVKSQIGTLK